MHNPNRPKALQSFLQKHKEIWKLTQRIAFLKVEHGEWPAIVFNEGNRSIAEKSNADFAKGVDSFPVLIDVVVDYEDYQTGYLIRGLIRKALWKFNGKLTPEREGTVGFRQFLSPEFNPQTNKVVFGSIYLLKQCYDYDTD